MRSPEADSRQLVPGATVSKGGAASFVVWAPLHDRLDIHILSGEERVVSMEASGDGYFSAKVDVREGARYMVRLRDGRELPDPASRYQPEGVHGPSQVVASDFPWDDGDWRGIDLSRYVIYELHVGTYTREGTFDAVIPHLDELRDLGVTAIELMPVAQFPGDRNWGYDGVALYAVQDSYGGPDGLRRLVNAAHERGVAVVLDVVYNHLGPEGNYLGQFGPYFTDRYQTAWGAAVNFDGPESDHVRRFFIENALMWVRDYHVDALRLDAVHAIIDHSAKPFVEELSEAVRAEAGRLDRRIHLMPETDLNDPRLVTPPDRGGYGLDAQWNDDFHHVLHCALTGESDGYYADYTGMSRLAKAFRRAYALAGDYSTYRKRRHGRPPVDLPGEKFIVFAQNHDQTGNRMRGERLSALTSFEGLKLAAGAVVLSPFLPLLFMGEEYGETAPFLYFVSHGDIDLLEAVRKGRAAEFAAFGWQEEPPDPASVETFQRSRLRHDLKTEGHHRVLLELHRELLRLRRSVPALSNLSLEDQQVEHSEEDGSLCVRRWYGTSEVFTAYNFGDSSISLIAPYVGSWDKVLDSSDERWGGPGAGAAEAIPGDGDGAVVLSAKSFALYQRK